MHLLSIAAYDANSCVTENVFRPSRRENGKRVRSRLYSGRYSLGRGEPAKTVPLHTPDERIARKRLRDIVVEEQREQEGLIAPRLIREAQKADLIELVADYAHDLKGRQLDERHVHDTIARIDRIRREAAWTKLSEVTPESFTRWRGKFQGSAKTRKEYQISINAFLNWLVRIEKIEGNPLNRLDRVDTRGKQVRPYRAFTEQEIRMLLRSVYPDRRIAYLTLLYTGQRRREIESLVCEDVGFEPKPEFRIRIETTKDKEKRTIALHPMLAGELRRLLPAGTPPTSPVFPNFPTYDALLADLARARIERRDSMGRVVHFHSFRKTWQTMGVRAGISQRVAQEILGHSDPALTANVYTDLAAIGTHEEIEKLPWLGDAQVHSLKPGKSDCFERFRGLLNELASLAKSFGTDGFTGGKLAFSQGVQWLPGLGSNQRPSD
jgi:integrase